MTPEEKLAARFSCHRWLVAHTVRPVQVLHHNAADARDEGSL